MFGSGDGGRDMARGGFRGKGKVQKERRDKELIRGKERQRIENGRTKEQRNIVGDDEWNRKTMTLWQHSVSWRKDVGWVKMTIYHSVVTRRDLTRVEVRAYPVQ